LWYWLGGGSYLILGSLSYTLFSLHRLVFVLTLGSLPYSIFCLILGGLGLTIGGYCLTLCGLCLTKEGYCITLGSLPYTFLSYSNGSLPYTGVFASYTRVFALHLGLCPTLGPLSYTYTVFLSYTRGSCLSLGSLSYFFFCSLIKGLFALDAGIALHYFLLSYTRGSWPYTGISVLRAKCLDFFFALGFLSNTGFFFVLQ